MDDQRLAAWQMTSHMQAAAVAKQQMDALNYMHGQFAALASKPDLNFDDVVNAAANIVRNNIARAAQVAEQLSQIPRERGQMRAWAMMRQAEAAEHMQRIARQNVDT